MKFIKQISSQEDVPAVIEASVILMNNSGVDINLEKEAVGGLVTELLEKKMFIGAPAQSYMENFCIIGALLSKDGGTWTIWNTNPEETGYWDPKSTTVSTPSTQYGEVVAVCVGRGLWAKIGWSGLTTSYKWASSSNDAIYSNYHVINIHGNGWESTKHMFDVHSDILTGAIWEQLKSGATTDYDLYLPSKYELLDIHNNTCDGDHVDEQSGGTSAHTFNKNLGKLLSLSIDSYWSSSPYAGFESDFHRAFIVNFRHGDMSSYSKTSYYRSVALLHFNN